MMPDEKPSGDGGFSNPTTFETMEEASAHAQKIVERDAMIRAMTPEERRIYFETMSNARPEDIE